MADDIGDIATALSWAVGASDAGSYAEAVNDVLVLAGATAIGDVGVAEARALARVSIWRRVVRYIGGDKSFENDGLSFSKEDQAHAQACLAIAETEAMSAGYLDTYLVKRTSIDSSLEDPFDTAFYDPQGRT